MLEIISFGEQCDQQFEVVQDKMSTLEKEQVKQSSMDV